MDKDMEFWRAFYGLGDSKRLTGRDLEMLDRMHRGEDVEEWKEEIKERWANYRVLRVFGSALIVRGNTYPVKEVLKDWNFVWNGYEKVWGRDLDDMGWEQVLKLAYDIGAEIEVQMMPEFIERDVFEKFPNVKAVYDGLREIAEFDEEEGVWRISVERVVEWKKEREKGLELGL